jgi:hypothetical protein
MDLLSKSVRAVLLASIAAMPFVMAPTHAWTYAVELGAGAAWQHPSRSWEDNPLAMARLQAIRGGWVFEWEHQSSLVDGPPINGNTDYRAQERFGVFYRWEWR